MTKDAPLTSVEIAKLRWAASHPEVKICDFDTVGDSLHDRGYLDTFDAGYVDWYGYWARISVKGLQALHNADQ